MGRGRCWSLRLRNRSTEKKKVAKCRGGACVAWRSRHFSNGVFAFFFSLSPRRQRRRKWRRHCRRRRCGRTEAQLDVARSLFWCGEVHCLHFFFFLDAVPKAEPIAMEMLDIEHAALAVDGIFSAPLLAFPVSAPLAEMFQSQTVTSAHFQL